MEVIYYKTSSGIQSVSIDLWSENLQQGEEFVWSHVEEKGVFHKHLKTLWAVTNYRIFIYDAEIQKITGLLMMSNLDDVVVMNSHRVYNSTRVGNYSSFARGFGISSGTSSGKSVSIGDVVFMSEGKSIITLGGISDPSGLKKIAMAVKKELYPRKEIQKFLNQNIGQNMPSPIDKSICIQCGNKNPQNASFCAKCGHILR